MPSGNQWLKRGMLLYEGEIFHPAVEPEHMARARDDERDQHAGIDQVIVDNEVVGVLDERPIHVREPVGDHETHAEGRADTDHQAGEQRQADQQVAVLHLEGGDRRHCWRGEDGEDVMEGLGVVEEADDGPIGYEDLVRGGVEERPRHEKAKIKNQSLWYRVWHWLPPSSG